MCFLLTYTVVSEKSSSQNHANSYILSIFLLKSLLVFLFQKSTYLLFGTHLLSCLFIFLFVLHLVNTEIWYGNIFLAKSDVMLFCLELIAQLMLLLSNHQYCGLWKCMHSWLECLWFFLLMCCSSCPMVDVFRANLLAILLVWELFVDSSYICC